MQLVGLTVQPSLRLDTYWHYQVMTPRSEPVLDDPDSRRVLLTLRRLSIGLAPDE
jgi:hypothetical protein